MSFRDEYKETVDRIVPDQEFVDALSQKMKREQEKKRKPYRLFAAAACVCVLLLAGLAGYLWNRAPEISEPVQVNTGNTLQNPTAEPNLFDPSKWYHEGDGAEKIFSGFVGRLQKKGEWSRVYRNTENYFTDDMLLSEGEILELADQIREAKVAGQKPEDAGREVYYMAEFENGDIIKFVLYEDGYFCFQDLDYIYKF